MTRASLLLLGCMLAFAPLPARAQTQIDYNTQIRNRPVQYGGTLPGSCSINGAIFVVTPTGVPYVCNGTAYLEIPASGISYQSGAVGSVPRNEQSKSDEVKSVLDFGAVGDGVTDNSTAFAAAAAWSNGGIGRTLTCPDGTYIYSTGFALTSPVTLTGGKGCVINYIGSAHAIDLGPTNLTVSTYQLQPYTLNGFTITGGSSATEGIYANPFIVTINLSNLTFYNFGNSTAWNIFLQFQNWYTRIDHIDMYSSATGPKFNGIRTNGYSTSNVSDFGNSRTIITNSIIQSFGSAVGGEAIYMNGAAGMINNTTIAGMAPTIQIGPWGNSVVIDRLYCETLANANVIVIGDTSGPNSGAWPQGVRISNSYCNLHNNDSFATTANFIAPVDGTHGINYLTLTNNVITSMNTSNYIVVENNINSQIGNYAADNQLTPIGTQMAANGYIHTLGSSIAPWNGVDGENFTLNNPTNHSQLLTIQAGSSADQFEGLVFNDHTGATQAQFARNASGGGISLTVGSATFVFSAAGQMVIPGNITANGAANINSPAAGTIPLYVNGFSGQTADLLDGAVNGGSNLFRVTSTGSVFAPGYNIIGGPAGVSCSGTPTSSFASVNGIVTHC